MPKKRSPQITDDEVREISRELHSEDDRVRDFRQIREVCDPDIRWFARPSLSSATYEEEFNL
jgi:hypothetical protein